MQLQFSIHRLSGEVIERSKGAVHGSVMQRLRESRRSVAQISADVGYESEIAFARAFKRQFSMSPARWRKVEVKGNHG